MRYYIFDTTGSCIAAEVAAPPQTGPNGWWPDDESRREHVWGFFNGPRYDVLSREQLLAGPTRRRALLAWESGDDAASDQTFREEYESATRDDLQMLAANGDAEALRLLRGNPLADEMSTYLSTHADAEVARGRLKPVK